MRMRPMFSTLLLASFGFLFVNTVALVLNGPLLISDVNSETNDRLNSGTNQRPRRITDSVYVRNGQDLGGVIDFTTIIPDRFPDIRDFLRELRSRNVVIEAPALEANVSVLEFAPCFAQRNEKRHCLKMFDVEFKWRFKKKSSIFRDLPGGRPS